MPHRLHRPELERHLRRRRPERAGAGDALARASSWCGEDARHPAAHAAVRPRPATIPATSRAICPACGRTAPSTPTPRSGPCSPPRSRATGTAPSSCSRCSTRSPRRTRRRRRDLQGRALRRRGRRLHGRGHARPRRVDLVHRLGELDVPGGAGGDPGLHEAGDTLRLDPRVPPGWPEFDLEYRFGGATYRVTAAEPGRAWAEARVVEMDGEALNLSWVPLVDNGAGARSDGSPEGAGDGYRLTRARSVSRRSPMRSAQPGHEPVGPSQRSSSTSAKKGPRSAGSPAA